MIDYSDLSILVNIVIFVKNDYNDCKTISYWSYLLSSLSIPK